MNYGKDMNALRTIGALGGAVIVSFGFSLYDWRLGFIVAGLLLLIASIAGMINDAGAVPRD